MRMQKDERVFMCHSLIRDTLLYKTKIHQACSGGKAAMQHSYWKDQLARGAKMFSVNLHVNPAIAPELQLFTSSSGGNNSS